MTPPDSDAVCGVTLGEDRVVYQCSRPKGHVGQHRDGNVTAWDQKPDSDAREVLPLRPVFGKALNGAWHIAVRTYPDAMDTACGRMKLPASEFFSCADTKARVWCVTCVNSRGAVMPEEVSLPLPLAQRILAALERESELAAAHGWHDRVMVLKALAAELRALLVTR